MRLRVVIVLVLALASSAMALTPRERTLALHASSELAAAIADRAKGKIETEAAKQEALKADKANSDSAESAKLANAKAVTAEAQAKKEHDELFRSATENAEMRPIFEQVNKWCGLGALIYGVGKILHCLMWLAIGIAALVVLLLVASIFVPALGPILRVGTGFFGSLWTRFTSLFKRKPTQPLV